MLRKYRRHRHRPQRLGFSPRPPTKRRSSYPNRPLTAPFGYTVTHRITSRSQRVVLSSHRHGWPRATGPNALLLERHPRLRMNRKTLNLCWPWSRPRRATSSSCHAIVSNYPGFTLASLRSECRPARKIFGNEPFTSICMPTHQFQRSRNSYAPCKRHRETPKGHIKDHNVCHLVAPSSGDGWGAGRERPVAGARSGSGAP